MGDMLIELNKKNDLSINEEVEISVSSEVKDIINYKFIEGYEGVWNSILQNKNVHGLLRMLEDI